MLVIPYTTKPSQTLVSRLMTASSSVMSQREPRVALVGLASSVRLESRPQVRLVGTGLVSPMGEGRGGLRGFMLEDRGGLRTEGDWRTEGEWRTGRDVEDWKGSGEERRVSAGGSRSPVAGGSHMDSSLPSLGTGPGLVSQHQQVWLLNCHRGNSTFYF